MASWCHFILVRCLIIDHIVLNCFYLSLLCVFMFTSHDFVADLNLLKSIFQGIDFIFLAKQFTINSFDFNLNLTGLASISHSTLNSWLLRSCSTIASSWNTSFLNTSLTIHCSRKAWSTKCTLCSHSVIWIKCGVSSFQRITIFVRFFHLCRCSCSHLSLNQNGVLLTSEFVDHLDKLLVLSGHSFV